MTASGVDARASFLSLAALIAFPIISILVLSHPTRRFGEPQARRWAASTAGAALVTSLWVALIDQNFFWTAVPPLLVFFAAWAAREQRASFSRRDAILIPTTLSVFLALLDLTPRLLFHQQLILSVMMVLALRIGLTTVRGSGSIPVSLCFAAAPLGLALQSHFNGYHQRHDGWPVLAIALGTPLAFRLLVRDTPRARRIIRSAVAWFVYPVAAVMYASATSLLAAEGKPHADLFENAHNLTPASEMLRGELPYRDITLAHGLLQDGLLDWLIMQTGEVTAGRVLEMHGVISSLNSVALYALPAALTGSPDIGMLTYFLGVLLRTSGGSFRVLPALLALVLLVAGVRRRDSRLIGLAGAGTVVAALTSLDFGAYTFVALAVALLRLWSGAAFRAAAIGVAAAAAIAAAGLALFRILDDFLRVTFFEILSLAPVYNLGPFIPNGSLRTRRFFPDVAGAFVDPDGFLYAVWIASLLALAVMITRRRDSSVWKRRGIREGLIVVLAWMVVTAMSYAERHHLYFHYVVPSVIGATICLLVRRRDSVRRAAAAGLVLVVVIASQPTHQLIVLTMLRRAKGPMSPGVTEVAKLPRAAGAYYKVRDAEVIGIVGDYINRRLGPDETFFDFTNRGALYFLLDRDVPIRQVEVAFYQTEERQHEVVAQIASNPKVRLALVPAADDQTVRVDGIANEARAPLVWRYLQEHFRPAYEERNVVFWERID